MPQDVDARVKPGHDEPRHKVPIRFSNSSTVIASQRVARMRARSQASRINRHSGMVRQHQTSDVQLHIGESLDSGFDAEPVIGPRFARTRWHRPGMTASLLLTRLRDLAA
jgi:hypothetical protein